MFVVSGGGAESSNDDVTSRHHVEQWWNKLLKEEDKTCLDHSGKLVLLFEILTLAQQLADKVSVSVLLGLCSKYQSWGLGPLSYDKTGSVFHSNSAKLGCWGQRMDKLVPSIDSNVSDIILCYWLNYKFLQC